MIEGGATVARHAHLAGCQVWTFGSQPLRAYGGVVNLKLSVAIQREPVGINVGISHGQIGAATSGQFIDDATL